jgi:tetratricopeptide (TPR) repeat protein
MWDRTADLAQGRIIVEVGRHSQARARLQRAVARNPESSEAWCLLALCHSALSRPGDMLAAAEQAVATEPDNEWGHRLRSYALTRLARHDDAVATAREAVRLAPHSWKTHAQLARALEAAGLAECLGAARRAVELGPDEPEAHYGLGRVAMGVLFVGDLAERSFRRALELDPDHARARESLAALERGEVAPVVAPPAAPPEEPPPPVAPSGRRGFREYLRAVFGPKGGKATHNTEEDH